MDKWKELRAAVAELRECGELLITISDNLKECISGEEKEEAEILPTTKKPTEGAKPDEPDEKKAVTKEEVRKVLGMKVKDGYRDEVQALFRKYGAEKLKDINPSKYGDLLKDAEVIGNA